MIEVKKNMEIPFAELNGIFDYLRGKFKALSPPLELNPNTALPMFGAALSGSASQMMVVAFDSGKVVGVAGAYVDRSPLEGRIICHSPMFFSDSSDVASMMADELKIHASKHGASMLRVDSAPGAPSLQGCLHVMAYVVELDKPTTHKE